MPRRRLIPIFMCAALLTACSTHRADDSSPTPANEMTTVEVDNRDFLDMTIYVLDGAQRVRLGTAGGHRTTTLTIPAYLIRGPEPLRFLCDPIGSSHAPVSDELVVHPGDTVSLIIPAS